MYIYIYIHVHRDCDHIIFIKLGGNIYRKPLYLMVTTHGFPVKTCGDHLGCRQAIDMAGWTPLHIAVWVSMDGRSLKNGATMIGHDMS